VAPERLRAAELVAEAETAERAATERRAEVEEAARRVAVREAELERELERVRASAEHARGEAVAAVERELAEARAEIAALRGDVREARRARRDADQDRALGAATERAARADFVLSRHKVEPLEATAPLAVGDPVEAPDVGVRGTIVAIAGRAVLPHLFAVMHTPADVTALGVEYLGTYLIGTPLIFGFFAVDAAFRASGDSRTPFILLAVSVAITLALDPILIMGIGPAPRLGIAGAAIATVATRSVAFALGLWMVIRGKQLRIGQFDWAAIRAVCRVGLPTAATGVVFSLIYVFVTRSATPFGTPALAALGIGHRVESWLYMIGVGFGAATAAIVGQNLGAGRVDRAQRAGWLATGFCTALGVVFCVMQLSVPELFAGIFSHDPAVVREGANYLRIAALSQLGICAEVVLEGALGGAGHTVAPMLSSTTITVARIPLAAWAATHWGSTGIWWVISSTALARGIAMVVLWRAGGWQRKTV